MRRKTSESAKKLENLRNTPAFKTAWAKICLFCPDHVALVLGTTPIEPMPIDRYDHLTTSGIVKFCAFWKVCDRHEAELLERAKRLDESEEQAPF